MILKRSQILIVFVGLIACVSLNAQVIVKGKVYDIGSDQYFNEQSFIFLFECDCCFDRVLFVSEQEFIQLSYCVSNVSLQKGYYKLSDEGVSLKFSGSITKVVYLGDDQPMYQVTSAFTGSDTLKFTPDGCKGSWIIHKQDKKIYLAASRNSIEQELNKLRALQLEEINKIVKDL